MSNRYTPDRKAAVLGLLQSNHGNVARTSAQTGVPVRTLYSWREALVLQQHTPSPSAMLQNPPEFSHDLETLAYVRRQIMAELASMAANLKDSLSIASPYQRAHILTQLLDRLMKLDAHLKPYDGVIEHVLVIPGDVEEDLDAEVNEVGWEDDDMDWASFPTLNTPSDRFDR